MPKNTTITPLELAIIEESATQRAPEDVPLYKWREPTPEDLEGCYTSIVPEDVRRYMAGLWADALGTWDNGELGGRLLIGMLMPKGGFTEAAKRTFVATVAKYLGMARWSPDRQGDGGSWFRPDDRLSSDYHGDPPLQEGAHAIGLSDMALPTKSSTSADNWDDSGNSKHTRWRVSESFGYGAGTVYHYLLDDGRIVNASTTVPWSWVDFWVAAPEHMPPGVEIAGTWR